LPRAVSACTFGAMSPEELADLEVLTTERERVKLGSLYADRPAVLVFLRHFG
jgi:hypothetical protein